MVAGVSRVKGRGQGLGTSRSWLAAAGAQQQERSPVPGASSGAA